MGGLKLFFFKTVRECLFCLDCTYYSERIGYDYKWSLIFKSLKTFCLNGLI